MLSKEDAKLKVKALIEYYNSKEAELSKQQEQDIRLKLIDRLFKILGWDTSGEENPDEVQREENIEGKEPTKKKADYIFRLGSVPKFIVEAKKIKGIDLHSEEFHKQVVGYSYNLACSWSILTNFKSLILYFEENPFYTINEIGNLENFEENFEKVLWKLSKESIREEILEKEAKIRGLKRSAKVDKQLYEDLKDWRQKLSSDIKKNYDNKYQPYEIEEIVQRIIDRLIFIRKIEDLGLEERKLYQLTRRFSDNTKYYKELIQIFKYYREKYNSGLFGVEEEQEPDRINISNNIIEKVIEGMYKPKDKKIEYNFAAIDADILGNIYEQYLAYILQETPKRTKLEGGRAHRKEQGIYYTPTYIVDYIVKNTVGEHIKDKTIDEILEIKILDPACGSGSFLIRTFQEICNIVKKKLTKGEKITHSTFRNYNGRLNLAQKTTILTRCIYGVDLDKKAVEIAQLNLLLKLLEGETSESISQLESTKKLLPMLNNIKNGNSLIDDKSFDEKHAFIWEDEFPFKFDVVIGNPPYVKARDTKDPKSRKYMETCGQFETLYKMWDLYIAFVERGIKLLKPNGCFAMIIPDTIGEADYSSKLVELIVNEYSLYQIDFFPDIEVFPGVGVRNKIIFIKNSKKIDECKRILHDLRLENVKDIGTMGNRNPNVFRLVLANINLDFNQTIPLENICYVSYGARFNSDKNDKIKFKKEDLVSNKEDKIHNKLYTEGKFIDKYKINKKMYVEWGTERCPKRLVRPTFPELYPPNKLLMSRIKRVTTYSDEGHVCDNTIIVGVPYHELKDINNKGIDKYVKNIKLNRKTAEIVSKKFDLKYILSILNSKLIKYFLNINSRSKLSIYPDDWKKIPIKEIDLAEQKLLIKFADKILELNKRLNVFGDKKTDERQRLEREIQEVDNQIDQEVYKLYGITPGEQKIIEESLK